MQLEFIDVVVGQGNFFPDGSDEYACPLAFCFSIQQAGQDLCIAFVQVADRFVQEDEVEGLAQAADEGHALLLAEGQEADLCIGFVGDARGFKQVAYLLAGFVSGQAVFQLDVFPGGQLREEAQFLEQQAERVASQGGPSGGAERADVFPVKGDDALIIIPIAIQIAAQRGFPCARCGLYQAPFPLAEGEVAVPEVGGDAVPAGKDAG